MGTVLIVGGVIITFAIYKLLNRFNYHDALLKCNKCKYFRGRVNKKRKEIYCEYICGWHTPNGVKRCEHYKNILKKER